MKLRTCLLVVTPILALCGQITSADLVKIEMPNNSSVATDRLEQLSKSLSGGSYAPNEQIEQLANSSLNVQLRTSLRDGNRKKTAMHVVNTTTDKRFNGRKLYADSTILYNPEDEKYYEKKLFKNNILMLRKIDYNYVEFLDLNSDEPYENRWSIACHKDRFTAEKSCMLNKYEFILLKTSKLGLFISVSREADKLNSREYQYLKIDSNPTFKTKSYFLGQSAIHIINQMQSGQIAYTRFYKGSHRYEETLSLYGFTVAYQTMNLIYAKL